MTRPSGRVAASGASPSEPGPNKARKARIGEDRADQIGELRRSAASPTPAERSSQRSADCGRRARLDAGQRSSSWWISVPRRAAARIASARRRRGFVVVGDGRRRQRPRRPRFGRRGPRRPIGHRDGGSSTSVLRPRLRRSRVPSRDSAAPRPTCVLLRLRAERPQRPLDVTVPAVVRARVGAVLARLGSTPLTTAARWRGSARRRAAANAPARSRFSSSAIISLERRAPLVLLAAGATAPAAHLDIEIDASAASAEPGRIGGRVGEDHDRRFEPLGAVDGHHPHRVGRLAGIALDLDVAAREPGEEAVERRRSRCARTPARWTSARRSGRAPPCPSRR